MGSCAHLEADKPAIKKRELSPYLAMTLARYAELQGDREHARQLYLKIDDPYALFALARINFITNNNNKALDALDKVIEEGSYATGALELRTKIYARTGKWSQAISDAERLIDKYPDNRELQLYLANLNMIVSNFKEAKTILEDLHIRYGDWQIRYYLAKAYFGDQDYIAAKNILEELTESQSEFRPAYLDLGKTYEVLGQPDKAQEVYGRLLAIDPTSKEALNAMAELYIEQQNYAQALVYIQTLMDLQPNEDHLKKLILLELQEKRYADARKHLLSIETMQDLDKYHLAIAYAGLEQWAEALSILEEILPEGEIGCDAILLKSSILKDMGRPNQALELLKTAWQKHSTEKAFKNLGYELATELESVGKRDLALEVSLGLLERYPHDPIGLNFVGYLWADEGIHLDRAYAMIQEALRMKPETGYILDSMAWVLFKMNRADDALYYMKKALHYLSDDPIINEHMGDILYHLQSTSEALDYYLKSSVLSGGSNEKLNKKIKNRFNEL